jgi:hypothetical protein
VQRWAGPSIGLIAAGLLGCAVAASAGVPDLESALVAGPSTTPARSTRPGVTAEVPLHDFYFARIQYTADGAYPGFKDWQTDFPLADRHFMGVLKSLSDVDAYDQGVPVRLDDPDLRKLPYLYAVEVGHMALTDAEAQELRDYLLAGGFLVVDDFWGTQEWTSFERQMKKVFPNRAIVDVPQEHPIFHSYYDIKAVEQVPNTGSGEALYRGDPNASTSESDGFVPHLRGIFDDHGRLMVAINWNTDLGDGWEGADMQDYPLRYSSYAMRIGVNTIVYAMSH